MPLAIGAKHYAFPIISTDWVRQGKVNTARHFKGTVSLAQEKSNPLVNVGIKK